MKSPAFKSPMIHVDAWSLHVKCLFLDSDLRSSDRGSLYFSYGKGLIYNAGLITNYYEHCKSQNATCDITMAFTNTFTSDTTVPVGGNFTEAVFD